MLTYISYHNAWLNQGVQHHKDNRQSKLLVLDYTRIHKTGKKPSRKRPNTRVDEETVHLATIIKSRTFQTDLDLGT